MDGTFNTFLEKTKQAALAKDSAARMTYVTSTKTCIGTPTTAVENLLPRDLAHVYNDQLKKTRSWKGASS